MMSLQGMTVQTLIAISCKQGACFYDAMGLQWEDEHGSLTIRCDLYDHTRDMQPYVRDAVCKTYKEAIRSEAFFIETVNNGERDLGYRLCRFHRNGGHRYSGEILPTIDAFWAAMRTLADMHDHPACQVDQ